MGVYVEIISFFIGWLNDCWFFEFFVLYIFFGLMFLKVFELSDIGIV